MKVIKKIPMAAIDKIYTDYNTYLKFKEWCDEQPLLEDKYGTKESISSYLINRPPFEEIKPIFMAPCYVDAYVIRHCSIKEIQEELMINYGHWSQKRIKQFYEDVKNWNGEGECPYWAKLEDFIFHEDGTIELKGLNKSPYKEIKEGLLHTSPKREDYEYGKHFKCIKHPKQMYNTAFKSKTYWIDVIPPEGFMWYHSNHNSWDFADEWVISDWSSSTAYCRTIRALKRLMLKWKLPIGTIVRATGRYRFDEYTFRITK